MSFFDALRNSINSIAGRKQEFDELLASKNISAIMEQMTSRQDLIVDAMKDYDTFQHPINFREDRIITDKNGNFIRREPVWKLPVPYPVYINEIALVFLYGRPVKWSQLSQNTDEAWAAFQDILKRTRFDSKIRQAKRLAGAETESAMLWRVFKDADGNPDVQIRVLAKSKGDDIRVRWDMYENIISIGWGYYLKEEKNNTVYHFDIFTPDKIYRCKRAAMGWDVVEEENLIGKIPIILFQQEKEWAGSEPLQHRSEYIASRTADTNDYFADPIAIMDADVVKNMPEKKDANKLLVVKGQDGLEKAAKYLTWDSAPESKKEEIEWLEDKILSMTFTPKISLETLKSVSQLSAKALNTVMMLANIKAAKRKETHDELLDRTANIVKAIIGNVMNVGLAQQVRDLKVGHEFQEPFADDIADAVNNITKLVDAGLLSTNTAVGLNPYVIDSAAEMEKIKTEKAEAAQLQRDLFSSTESEEDIQGSAE